MPFEPTPTPAASTSSLLPLSSPPQPSSSSPVQSSPSQSIDDLVKQTLDLSTQDEDFWSERSDQNDEFAGLEQQGIEIDFRPQDLLGQLFAADQEADTPAFALRDLRTSGISSIHPILRASFTRFEEDVHEYQQWREEVEGREDTQRARSVHD